MAKNKLRHVTVLAVDDDPTFLKMQKRILDSLGARHIINVTSAADALGELNHDEGYISVILLDLNMPERDGIDFLKKLRKHSNERIASLPVIVVSGESVDDYEGELDGLEITGYLSKPVVPELLESEILIALE